MMDILKTLKAVPNGTQYILVTEERIEIISEIERLKNIADDDEVYKLSCDAIVKDEEIEQLRKGLEEIVVYAKKIDGYYCIEMLNQSLTVIMEMCNKHLRGNK